MVVRNASRRSRDITATFYDHEHSPSVRECTCHFFLMRYEARLDLSDGIFMMMEERALWALALELAQIVSVVSMPRSTMTGNGLLCWVSSYKE